MPSRRGPRGAPADAEGAHRRAARRLAPGSDDYLLLTEPEAGERLARELLRGAVRGEVRDRARGAPLDRRARRAGAVGASARACFRPPTTACRLSSCSTRMPPTTPSRSARTSSSGCGSSRARRGSAASSTIACMPAEAGLEERAISFTKGCYPGQEPVARLHYRGQPNRGLRVLALDGDEPPDVRRRARRSTARSSGASRAPRRTRSTASSRSPTSAARCRRTRSSRWAAGRARQLG